MNEVNTSGGVLNPFFRPPEPEIPTKLPNPQALKFTGGSTASYDGSKAVSVEILKIEDITSEVAAIGDNAINGTTAIKIGNAVIITLSVTLGTSSGGWTDIAKLPVQPVRTSYTSLSVYGNIILDVSITTAGVIRVFFASSDKGKHGTFTAVIPVK